jgi:hypothetical protein
MRYQKTVTAAVAETKSKFRLAEALAEDIPPRQPGPSEDATIGEYLAEARQAILDAGGEDRSVGTLAHYRKTALWVRDVNVLNYRWVDGFSFTAHNEARLAGLSYDEFARIIGTWTPEQKANAARELLADPQVASNVIEDKTSRVTVMGALDDHLRDRDRAHEARRPDRSHAAAQLQLIVDFRRIHRTISSVATAVAEGRAVVSEEERDALLIEVAWLRNALDHIESGLRSGSLDAELATLVEGDAR